MRRGLKVSRGAQLIGAVSLIMGVVACSQRSDPTSMSMLFLAGGLMVIGARVYEWLTKE